MSNLIINSIVRTKDLYLYLWDDTNHSNCLTIRTSFLGANSRGRESRIIHNELDPYYLNWLIGLILNWYVINGQYLSFRGGTYRAGVNKGGYSQNTPPEIENFQNTPPEFWDFQETPPPSPRGLGKRGRFLPKNGQFSRKFGHFVGHFRWIR